MKKYTEGYRKELFLAPFFKFLEVIFDLAVPMLMVWVMDIGIANKDTDYIVRMIILIIALGILGFSCTLVAQYFAAKGSVGVTSNLKQALFAHIQSFSAKEIDTFSSSSLISRITNDTNIFQNGLNMALRLLVRSPFIVSGALLMAYTISKRLSLIFLVTILLLGIIVTVIMLVTIPMYDAVQSQLDAVLSKLKDNLAGVRILRAFNKQQEEITEFKDATTTLSNRQKKVISIANILNPLTYSLVNVAIVLLIHFGAIEIHSGSLTSGQLIALYNYMSQILVELIKLVNLIILITKAIASYRRIRQVLDTECELKTGEATVPASNSIKAVEFRDVCFRYPNGSEDILENISFTLNKGESLGIIGATGSGKSTLVDLLEHHYDVRCGEILIDGSNIQQYPLAQLHEKIASVYQKAVLFAGTVRSNMLMAKPDASDQEIEVALRKAQVWDVINGELDREVNQGGTNFSGGQRQRLTIAQAFLKNSEIMLLDDATSALDFKTESLVKGELAKMDGSLILVSQRVNNIKDCDHILILDNGYNAGYGTHEELLKDNTTYQEIYYSQNKKEDR